MYAKLTSVLTARQAVRLRESELPGNWRYEIPCRFGTGYMRLTPCPPPNFPVHDPGFEPPANVNFMLALRPRHDTCYDLLFWLPWKKPRGPWALAGHVTNALARMGCASTLHFQTMAGPIQATLPAAQASELDKTTRELCQVGPKLWQHGQDELRKAWRQLLGQNEQAAYVELGTAHLGLQTMTDLTTHLLELAQKKRKPAALLHDRVKIVEYWAHTLGH